MEKITSDKWNLPDDFDPDAPKQFSDEESAVKYAFQRTVARAHDGDPAAQYALALAILKFGDFPHRDATAFQWLKRAADVGYTPAKIMLKDM